MRLIWVPEEESGAVQLHRGSHFNPQCVWASVRLKFWRLGALRLCVTTYHGYLKELQTIEAFMRGFQGQAMTAAAGGHAETKRLLAGEARLFN